MRLGISLYLRDREWRWQPMGSGYESEETFDDSTALQFFGSEAYRRDVALTDPKIRQIFGRKQIRDWLKRAERLNRQGRGDQTGFVLQAR